MGVKRTLVEILHDEGYGGMLLSHMNNAFGSKDMQAMRIVPPAEINAELLQHLTQLVDMVGLIATNNAQYTVWVEAKAFLKKLGSDQVAPPAIEEIPSISELRYGPEMWQVDKTVIYNAITAIETALTYMPHVQTDVPRFQRALQNDIEQMERAVADLRRAEPWNPSMPIPGKDD